MSEEKKPRLRYVMIFRNGMVACFDKAGHQIPELQGLFRDKETEITEYAKDYWLDVGVTRE